MTDDITQDQTPELTDPDAATPRRLAAWHLVWSVAVLIGALGVNWAAGGLPTNAAIALGAGLLPGLVVMAMVALGGMRGAPLLIPLWAISGAVAVLFTGGLGGPMAAWCVAPLAVAGATGRRGALGLGAAVSVVTLVIVAFLQLARLAEPPPSGMAAFALGITAISALILGVGAGYFTARRSRAAQSQTPPAAAGDAALLDAQPFLVFQIEPDNSVSAVHGGLDAPVEEGRPYYEGARTEDHGMLAALANVTRKGEGQTVIFIPQADLDRQLTLDLAPMREGRVAGVLRDTTDARDREEALEAAKTDAENAAAGKSRFLASMSHELRTPLNAIMGFSDIMKNRMFGELPDRYVEYADLIHESGAHLLDLINDVLDMSKIEAQRYELNLEPMDAREPVQAAMRILRRLADEADVKLRATLPSEPVNVDADRRALKQITLNLVSNALKFTPEGGSVIVGLTTHGENLELTVADTGVGIAPEDLERIGRPYEQAGDTTGKAKGTGLGLSLVRAFAELHGGEMLIESRLGEGTAVTVVMPVVESGANGAGVQGDNVVAFNPQR